MTRMPYALCEIKDLPIPALAIPPMHPVRPQQRRFPELRFPCGENPIPADRHRPAPPQPP